MPQGGDQVGLPSAGQAEDQDVLGPIDELALAQLGELTANAQGQPLLVEGLQGLAGREVRCFGQTQDAPLAPSGHLLLQQLLQERLQRPVLPLSGGQGIIHDLTHRGQA
jgi:hypothetical protein